MAINAIVACDTAYGIGKDNSLPWPHNSEDMKWFQQNTLGHVVVMGRKTWESIGCRPLPKRINLVVSRSKIAGDPDGIYYGEMPKLLQTIQMTYPHLHVWVIGGGEIYRQALPICDNLYLTKFKQQYDCDTFLDRRLVEPFQKLIFERNIDDCTFTQWGRL